MNYIWSGMILLSLIAGFFTGRINEVAAAAVDGATGAVTLCVSLLGIMCLWTGLAKIGERAGLIDRIARIMRPVIRFLFPALNKTDAAVGAIVMNIVANLLGMGNAATPLGIAAMRELDRKNGFRGDASDEMCMFAVINTASLQLIPTTVISLRQSFGSAEASAIIVPVWISGICALAAGITAAKLFQRRKRL